jgi:hypothetical protein
VGHVAYVTDENAHGILIGKREGKRPRRRSRCKWEDNIRVDVRQICWVVVDWIGTSGRPLGTR